MGGADVRDPEAIKDVRLAMVRFLRTCDGALGGYTSELARVRELLRGECQTHWRRQVTKFEEAYQEARRQYLEAEQDMRDAEHRRGAAGKQSAIDERLVMDRARRRREEAEAKLASTRAWLLRLDRDGDAAASQCQAHVLGLRERAGEAIARLERMHDRLMDYLDIRPAAGTPQPTGGGSLAVTEAPTDAPASEDRAAAVAPPAEDPPPRSAPLHAPPSDAAGPPQEER